MFGDTDHGIDVLRYAAAESCRDAIQSLQQSVRAAKPQLIALTAPHSWMALAVLAESRLDDVKLMTPTEWRQDKPFDMSRGRIHNVLDALDGLPSKGIAVMPCAVPKDSHIEVMRQLLLTDSSKAACSIVLLSEVDSTSEWQESAGLPVVDLNHHGEAFLAVLLEKWADVPRSEAPIFVRYQRQPGQPGQAEKSIRDVFNDWLGNPPEELKDDVELWRSPVQNEALREALSKLIQDRDRPSLAAAMFVASHFPNLEISLFHSIVGGIALKEEVDPSLLDKKERASLRKRTYTLDDQSMKECGIRVITRNGVACVKLRRQEEPQWTTKIVLAFIETETPLLRARLFQAMQSTYWLAMEMDDESTRALIRSVALSIKEARGRSKTEFAASIQAVAWGKAGRAAWSAESNVATLGRAGLRRAADRWVTLVDAISQEAPELRNACVIAILEGGFRDVPHEYLRDQAVLKARLLLQCYTPGTADVQLSEFRHLCGLEPEDYGVQQFLLHLLSSTFFNRAAGDDSPYLEARLRPDLLAGFVAEVALRFDSLAPGFREAFMSLLCVALLQTTACNRNWREVMSGVADLAPAVRHGKEILTVLWRCLPTLLNHDGGAEHEVVLSGENALLHAWVLSDLAVGSQAWSEARDAAFDAFMGHGAHLIYSDPVAIGIRQPVSFFDRGLWEKERKRDSIDADAMAPFLSLCDRLYCALPLFIAMLLSTASEIEDEGRTFDSPASVKDWIAAFTPPTVMPQRMQGEVLLDSMKGLVSYMEAWRTSLLQSQDRRLSANIEVAKMRLQERMATLREFGRHVQQGARHAIKSA